MVYRTVKGSFQNKLKNLIYKAGREANIKHSSKEANLFYIGFLYGLIDARDLHYELEKKKRKRHLKVLEKGVL